MNNLDLLVSVQRALLGHITPNLRAVYILHDQGVIRFVFYYDKSPSPEDEEQASLADTEFISDFPLPDYKTEFQIILLPYPKIIPRDGLCAYKRFEK